ncbi:hypothetical protein [Rhizobium leguminosarum]|uniref:hypothetical protein n=1 Tax=Rhizobium leguminosarum TaxID=384 RepID=UPI00103E11D3|nr:hypothetical protein [Rhizobium leguminosarum]TCA26248.1 hypothetical protein E0H67_04835 [Rhizobium leguminosarum bv. viciae]
MTWIIIAVVVVGALFFFMSSSMKSAAANTARLASSASSTEDSRRYLEALFSENRLRVQGMPDSEIREFISALRQEADTHWSHAYSTCMGDGRGEKLAKQLALFRTAAVILTGEQQPDQSLYGGLDLETEPFKAMSADQAKAMFVEYCVAKYAPGSADWISLNQGLLSFGDKVFEDSKSQPTPDHYVYQMIYRETLDWQKFLARAISERLKPDP